MGKIVLGAAVCFLYPTFLVAQDIRPVPEDQARSIGAKLVELADKIDKPQVKIESDASKANGIHVPDKLGILVIPQKDLKESDELAAKFKAERGAPLAYLFAYRVLPVIDGKRIDASRVRTLKVTDKEGTERTAYVLLLSVRQTGEDDYRLYAYGTEDQPLVDAKFAPGDDAGTGPVVVEVKDPDEQTQEGNVVVTVFGKYRASFRAGYEGD